MKRHLCLSILVAALAASGAQAGANIVKCVDGDGRVTLTDQACEHGATMVRLASMPADEGVTRAAPYPLITERGVLPPAPAAQRRQPAQRAKAKPLMRDVVTLKAARAQFLLMDAAGASKHTLATLD
ncbi:DUF4124 domain-containing protein [Massilia sp.]|uniref:DUF4124 domain-containing protein n=1 Tax=Massilia sp. TaxID=1882437 RepID=UPI00391998AD